MINFDLRTSYFWVVFLSILLSICFPLHQEFWFAFSSISIVKSSKSAHKWFRSANLPWSSMLFELHLTLCFFLAIGVLQYFSDEPFLWSYSLYSGRSLRSASLCIPQFCPPSSSQLLKLHFTSFQLQPEQRCFDLLAARRGWNTSDVAPSWCNSLPHMAQAIGWKVKTWKKEGVAAL